MTPLEIITKGQWDSSLFTTYALSLSFYETQLHKLGLARNGCRDIRILTDIDGYQLSLSERQSHRVGNEYRVVPAALPNGVFHPKLTWLGGKEFDLLLIGSGNLTFGGFGKNVECLEVVRSDLNPVFFGQIANLFRDWERRHDLQFAETDWFRFWIERAEAIALQPTTQQASSKTLLHSTNRSIGDQLIEMVENRGDVVEVRSLSPFYDPDGAGILSFAETILTPRLTIGLLPGRESQSTFPFSRSRQTSIEIGAAIFEAPEDHRHLHAKVLEIEFANGTSLVLTGSVNATRKSLLTSDNIETAVLREFPDAKNLPFQWNPTETPAHSNKLAYQKAGLGNRVVVSARLTAEGRLDGSLLSKQSPEGRWEGILQRIDGETTKVDLSVDSQGQFSSTFENLELFQSAIGLQLLVERDDQQGAGWVSVEGLLLAAKRGFLSPSTLIRLQGPDADESDEAELLRYLAVSAQRHLTAYSASPRTSGPRSPSKKEEDVGDDRAVSVPRSRLISTEFISPEDSVHPDYDQEEHVLNGYIQRIRANLLRGINRQVRSTEEVDETPDDSAARKEEKEREQNRKQLNDSISMFETSMRNLVSSLPPGVRRCAAFCMWIETTFPTLRKHPDESRDPKLFLRGWVSEALKRQKRSGSTEIFVRHVLGTMLTLSADVIARRDAQETQPLGRVHEQLDSFCEGEDPKKLCEELELFDPKQPPMAAVVLKDLPEAPSLEQTLAEILSSPTPRHQLEQVRLAIAEGRQPSPTDFPILDLESGMKYLGRVRAGDSPKVKQLKTSDHVCPHCHLRLRPATLTEIHRDRFGFCLNCENLLLAPS